LFKTICKKYKGPEITQSASGNTKIPRWKSKLKSVCRTYDINVYT
jgi:hypothetical protein